MSELTSKDGWIHGLHTTWYKNGQKRKEGNYRYDEHDGLWTSWYSNGQKKSETTYNGVGNAISHKGWNEDGYRDDSVIW